jgi:hypothetical protein
LELGLIGEGPPFFWGPDAVRASGTPFLTDRNFLI